MSLKVSLPRIMSKGRPPFWLLPNICSLDAPLVAVVWMWMLAHSMQVIYVPQVAYILLPLIVWMVYTLDRILDVRGGVYPHEEQMPWRHQFHWKYRYVLIFLMILGAVVTGYLSLAYLSTAVLSAGLVGGGLILLYGVMVRYRTSQSVPYAKNLVAGLIFAYGTATPVIVHAGLPMMTVVDVWSSVSEQQGSWLGSGLQMVIYTIGTIIFSSPLVFFMGLLFFLNITAIDLWESSRESKDLEHKTFNEAMLSFGLICLVGVVFLWAIWGADQMARPFCYALMASAGFLQLINKARSRFSLEAQRVLADVALLLPLGILYFQT